MKNNTINMTVSCYLCTEYSKTRGCTAKHCPYFAERIAAGALHYKLAVTEAFQSIPLFAERWKPIHKRLSNSIWHDAAHQKRLDYLRLWAGKCGAAQSNESLAAMYLLSATQPLYDRAFPCVTKHEPEFALMNCKGLSIEEYTLLGTAKTLCFGTEDLTAEDIGEAEIVSAAVLPLIIHAVLIVRFGEEVLRSDW